MENALLANSPLGKPATYAGVYQSELLFPISRAPFRQKLNIDGALPFHGYDLWNSYELSWLNSKGKPVSAIAQFLIPCTSPNIIEAKSFKLYLNSYHQTTFSSRDEVTFSLAKDLSACVSAPVLLEVALISEISACELGRLSGSCLDTLDIETNVYTVTPSLLVTEKEEVEETLYTDLFKSNCLGTGQPDWGSIQISYQGPKINPEQLLKYLVSFRQHHEFNEHCIERVFMDILHQCRPKDLTVKGHFTRRGGLDTNPCRSTNPNVPIDSARCFRQ